MRGLLDANTMAAGISGTKKVEAPMSVVGAVDASPPLGWRRTRAGGEATLRYSMRPHRSRRIAAVHSAAARRRAIDSTMLAHLEGDIARLVLLVALATVTVMIVLPRLLELAAAAGA
jgi:hypothetical protein